MGAAARDAHGGDDRARRRRPRLGASRLGARRRDARRRRRLSCARSTSRRVSSSSCARCIRASAFTLDGRDARRGRPRARPDRRGGGARTRPSYERDRERIDDWKAHPLRALVVLAALAILPALGVVALVFWFFGRERETGYDREYEQEPPTDTEPALVPTLLRQGGEAGLVRVHGDALRPHPPRRLQGRARRRPSERSGAGLRTENVADLELSAGEPQELTALGGRRRRRRRRGARRRLRAALALPRADRGRARVDVEALRRRSRTGVDDEVDRARLVPLARRAAARRRRRRLRRRRR